MNIFKTFDEIIKSGNKYKLLLGDPPWAYGATKNTNCSLWGVTQNHYSTMSQDDLKKLPVSSITADDSMLFMWATFPNLQQGLDVMKAWGFEYKTVAFVWVKQSKTSCTPKKYGLGWYTRSNCEIVMLGRKGKFVRNAANVQQVIQTALREHSRKPDEVRTRILKLCGDLTPRIELFPRRTTPTWDAFGNDPKLDNKPLESFYET